jgi:threonine dehydratase
MSRSLEKGGPCPSGEVDTIADGLAPPFAGEHTFAHVQRFVDEMVRVSDEAILNALRMLVERCKLAAEPSGAAALAALISGRVVPASGSTVVCVVSGGNVGAGLLTQLL